MSLTEKELSSIIELLKQELVPVGTILIFPAEKVPAGYLPCDGRELPKNCYLKLYEIIGATWGETKNTFFLPDLQGQFVRGWDKDGDVDSERIFGSLQEDAFQGHSHKSDCSYAGGHKHRIPQYVSTIQNAKTFFTKEYYTMISIDEKKSEDSKYYTSREYAHKHDIPIGEPVDSSYGSIRNRISTETRPKNVALMFCIKVK